ncbi:MAG: hypothetical protein MUF79_08940 [Burkholderiales bacterium]|jgi:Ni/Co efflux regulator RcnB|nr:hypothetical protein [Burkholderiales bacterium]
MHKILSLVAAALFAATSLPAAAADAESKKEQRPAPAADAKKSDKAAPSKSDAAKK